MDEREHLHHCLRLLASSDDPRHANHVMTALDSYLDSKLKRGWIGLTDDETDILITLHAPPIHPDFNDDDDFIELVSAIEAKLKEKNHA